MLYQAKRKSRIITKIILLNFVFQHIKIKQCYKIPLNQTLL